VPSLITALVAYLVIRSVWNPEAAAQEMVAVLLSLLSGAILTPVLQFSWHFYKAPYRMLEDRLQEVVRECDVLKARLEAITGPISVRDVLVGMMRDGNELLVQIEQRRVHQGLSKIFPMDLANRVQDWNRKCFQYLNINLPEFAFGFIPPSYYDIRGLEAIDDLDKFMRDHLQSLSRAIQALDGRVR